MQAVKTLTGSLVTLSCGTIIGEPHDTNEYRTTAKMLGYEDDTLAMCQDHDPLHVAFCKWLGLDLSYSLHVATGDLTDPKNKELADLEETAVMAIQKFAKYSGAKIPVDD